MSAIIVNNLGKRFRRYHADRPQTIMEAALAGWRRLRPVDWFWALEEIEFRVEAGQMLGILGHNGAGKSTLLQLIGGVGRPDRGQAIVRGRVGALLDLGAGFHPDLTGRENIWIAAVSAGMTRPEVRRVLTEMVEFAELASFIDSPLRTYSTGMQMRLAFSVAIHTSPEVLLVDEHLAVGDLAFQVKCLDRIAELKAQGCAIVLISQSAEEVRKLCDRALWLDRGRMMALGDPDAVAAQYASSKNTTGLASLGADRTRTVEILTVTCLNRRQQPISRLKTGSELTVAIEYRLHQPISGCIFIVSVDPERGPTYLKMSSETARLSLDSAQKTGRVCLHLARLDLGCGHYYINVAAYDSNWQATFDYCWQKATLQIYGAEDPDSIVSPPRVWEILSCEGVSKPAFRKKKASDYVSRDN